MVVNRVLASSKSRYRFWVLKVRNRQPKMCILARTEAKLERTLLAFFLVFELLLPNGVLSGPKNWHVYGGVV